MRPDDAERERELRRKQNHRAYMRRAGRRAAGDTAGRSILLHYRCNEQLVAILDRLVTEGYTTGRYKWRTRNECLDALIRRGLVGIREESEEDPGIEGRLKMMEVAHQLEEVEQQRRGIQIIANRLHQEVTQLLSEGMKTEALQYYRTTMGAIEALPPTVHRDLALRKLKKEFRQLSRAKHIPGVSLKLVPTKKL